MKYYFDIMGGPIGSQYMGFMRDIVKYPEANFPPPEWRIKWPKDGTKMLEIFRSVRETTLAVEIGMPDGSVWITVQPASRLHGNNPLYICPNGAHIVEIMRGVAFRVDDECFYGSLNLNYRGTGYLSHVSLDASGLHEKTVRRIVQAVGQTALRDFRQGTEKTDQPADTAEALILSHATAQKAGGVPLTKAHLITKQPNRRSQKTFLSTFPERIEGPEQLFDMIRSEIHCVLSSI